MFHGWEEKLVSWESFLRQFCGMITLALSKLLPARYAPAPIVRLANNGEPLDLAAEDRESSEPPGFTFDSDLPDLPVFDVNVYDMHRGRSLASAILIVSPANKDRPDTRRWFAAKCAALLQQRVSVTVIDLVTSKHFNLYAELLEMLGHSDPALPPEPSPIYAVACRTAKPADAWQLEAWVQPLAVGQPLPTLPLWLAQNIFVPLELEASYEETCRALRIA